MGKKSVAGSTEFGQILIELLILTSTILALAMIAHKIIGQSEREIKKARCCTNKFLEKDAEGAGYDGVW